MRGARPLPRGEQPLNCIRTRPRARIVGFADASGGHMAKGHPLGASGAILLSSLIYRLDDAQGRCGLVVCTGAAGTGAA